MQRETFEKLLDDMNEEELFKVYALLLSLQSKREETRPLRQLDQESRHTGA